MRRFVALLVLVALAVPALTGCESKARARCKAAVRQAYEDEDRVFEQPSDLDGFCKAWHDHPLGYNLP